MMKALAAGLLLAKPALKWLLNQPIASCVLGELAITELEENSSVGKSDWRLTTEEKARAAEP